MWKYLAVIVGTTALIAAACGGADASPALRLELAVAVDESIDAESAAEIMDTVAATIRNRLSGLDDPPPEVERVGPRTLVVLYRDLPAATVEEITALLTATGRLEFREIDPINPTVSASTDRSATSPNDDVIVDGATRWIPATGTDRIHGTGEEVQLTGSFLIANSINSTLDSTGRPAIAFSFNDEGADLFEQITMRLALTIAPLGIFVDGQLITSPLITAMSSDHGIINGLTAAQTTILAAQMRSGTLAAPVTVVSVKLGNANP